MATRSATFRFEGGPLDGVQWECAPPWPERVQWHKGQGKDRGVIAWTGATGGTGIWGVEGDNQAARLRSMPTGAGNGASEGAGIRYWLHKQDGVYRLNPPAGVAETDAQR